MDYDGVGYCYTPLECYTVFIDIEHDMYCIDPEKIEEKLPVDQKRPVIDIFGQSAEMDKILSIARNIIC